MNMPSPRLFYETELNPAPLPDTQQQSQDEQDDEDSCEEYYVVKGGADDGIYKDMAAAIEAKGRSGGEFAVFSSRKEAELYLRPAEAFVVWAGREVGIMTKAQCIKTTQKLQGAQLCGPLSQADAKQKWSQVKAKAKVIKNKPAVPTTPTKETMKRNQQTPKKKKYFYAVAVGKRRL